MRLLVHHTTVYRYKGPVRENTNQIRLLPRTFPRQRPIGEELRIDPDVPILFSNDHWGNRVVHFSVQRPHTRLQIDSIVQVETLPAPDLDAVLVPLPAVQVAHELRDFLLPTRLTALPGAQTLPGEVEEARQNAPHAVGFLDWLAGYLHWWLHYEPGLTTVESSVADMLAAGGGVCQDFAHLFIGICRSVGLPARYAGGYHYQGPEAERHENHAWAEVYLPGVEWVGWDPANGIRVGEAHVQITAGRDYADVSPVRGSYRGAVGAELEVRLHMAEI